MQCRTQHEWQVTVVTKSGSAEARHSLLHSFTPSLLHSFTPSLLHYFTHYFTPSLTLILIFSLLETHAAEWETELHGTRDSALWTHFLQG